MSKSVRPLWQLTLLALAAKTVILIADPNPQFFLGDSSSYLHTALTGWIPPDRSYLYGYLIHWLCVSSESLFSLVLVQTMASSFSAGIVGWNLQRFMGTSQMTATVVTLAYSLDPLQLMYERFVMAEAFSLLATMVFVSFLFLFINTARKRFLVFASLAGVISVALRNSFLPPVVALSFGAPVIPFFCNHSEQPQDIRARSKALLASMAIIAISHFTLHTGYKLVTGRLAGAPPAYQYADGLSLLSSWSPVMNVDDLRAVGVSEHIFDGTYPRTLESRRAQRWMENGIVTALNRSYPDPLKANMIAKQISFHMLRRDPVGVANLAVRTYLRAWRRDVIKGCIKEDTGDRVIPPDLVQRSAKRFHIAAADMPTRRTWTKSYFRHATEWYRALLLTPLLLLVTTLFSRPSYRPFLLAVTLYAVVVMLTTMGLAVDNSIRYLHPLSWTFFVFAGYWADALLRRIRLSNQPWLQRTVIAFVCACLFGSVSAAAESATGPKGLYVRDGVLMSHGKPYRGIGANYNTLFGSLLQNKNDTSSLDKLARLGKAGIPFVRFRAGGYGPENQRLYLQDRPEYFRRMDQVVRCAEQNNIGLIPSLFWRLATVSELVGENRDQLGNPGSKANQFIRQYTREMVSRYNDSPAIWGWEFGNEANLGVDLGNPAMRRVKGGPLFGLAGQRPEGGRLSSEQLRTAYAVFAETVRSIDRSRIIEPGTGLPRPSAWHLAHGQAGQLDNSAQAFSSLLNLTPDPMNMISVHVYEKAKSVYPGARRTEDVLTVLAQAAAGAHKPLFLGEFPTRDRTQAEEFLRAIEGVHVPLSAFWVFDYPAQEGTMSVSFDNERSFVLDLIAKANRVLQPE